MEPAAESGPDAHRDYRRAMRFHHATYAVAGALRGHAGDFGKDRRSISRSGPQHAAPRRARQCGRIILAAPFRQRLRGGRTPDRSNDRETRSMAETHWSKSGLHSRASRAGAVAATVDIGRTTIAARRI